MYDCEFFLYYFNININTCTDTAQKSFHAKIYPDVFHIQPFILFYFKYPEIISYQIFLIFFHL